MSDVNVRPMKLFYYFRKEYYYLHNRGNIFMKQIHSFFVQFPLLESFPTSLLGNYQMSVHFL